MKRFIVGILALVAMTGCAGEQRCMRDVSELERVSRQQDAKIRELEGELIIMDIQKASVDGNLLGMQAWEAAKHAAGWIQAETPLVQERLRKAQECFNDHSNGPPLSFEEYRTIAETCLK